MAKNVFTKLTIFTMIFLLMASFNCNAATQSEYDNLILGDKPVGYWPLAPGNGKDISGNCYHGRFRGNPSGGKLPNGEDVTVFNGIDQYFTVWDNKYLEITRTGVLTIEAWIRPDVLNFKDPEGSGYVHWLGKGGFGQNTYVARMYNHDDTKENPPRPNRISGYAFKKEGGQGAGSYFQDAVTPGEWIHYTLVINTIVIDPKTNYGYVKIYKNGVLKDTDTLGGKYEIVPSDGTAPLNIGTCDLESYFEGAIGKVALYDYELTEDQINSHYQNMTTTNSSIVLGSPKSE